MTNTKRRTYAVPPLLGLLVIAALAATSARVARAVEFIPSYGLTQSTETNAGDAQGFGGIAWRIPVAPLLKLEGGIAYRKDSFAGGTLEVHQLPVTASVWLSPLTALYVGGGVGWYHTTLDYSSALPIKDSTTDKAGVHLGGGVGFPIAPKLSLDLNGRYIFMTRDKATFEVPTTFNPDFWSATLGLAISY